jgi:hypothetical protein
VAVSTCRNVAITITTTHPASLRRPLPSGQVRGRLRHERSLVDVPTARHAARSPSLPGPRRPTRRPWSRSCSRPSYPAC